MDIALHIARHPKEWRNGHILKAKSSYRLGHKFLKREKEHPCYCLQFLSELYNMRTFLESRIEI